MSNDLDGLLAQLRSRASDADLSGLETAISRRIAREQASRNVPGLKLQLAVVCTALILGLAVAEIRGYSAMPQGLNSELIVLSDDGVLAPSVRLGGGT
jgi:hypothetical protein